MKEYLIQQKKHGMKTLLELLEKIKYYSAWSDTDSRLDLVLFLDEIRGLSIDAIEMLKKESNRKPEPIRLGLILEGEDAREFEERMKHPKVTKEQIEFIKEAIEIYRTHPF